MKQLNYKKIGERLKKLRNYMGLTQSQVASILNIGRDAVLRIENGNRKIDLEELVKFSKLYSISVDELIEDTQHSINNEIIFARGLKGFDNLSANDKKEIISLIEYKNIINSKK